ncbi:hypothetical protein PENTCL1PPCAC_257, partial [Pristionchus entomophagus]
SKHSIVLFENKSYSSDFIRRIAHNASIGTLRIILTGSSELHREVYNLLKEMDIGMLSLHFGNKELEREIMMEPFILSLARTCKELLASFNYVTPSTIHELYQIMLVGSAKIRLVRLLTFVVEFEKSIEFFKLIGITFRDGAFFSNRDIEDEEGEEEEKVTYWHIFDGYLEIMLEENYYEISYANDMRGYFDLIRHETRKSLEEAKNKKGMKRIEIDPE